MHVSTFGKFFSLSFIFSLLANTIHVRSFLMQLDTLQFCDSMHMSTKGIGVYHKSKSNESENQSVYIVMPSASILLSIIPLILAYYLEYPKYTLHQIMSVLPMTLCLIMISVIKSICDVDNALNSLSRSMYKLKGA